jgi:ubiquinone/menaquinone biosynthesis C-methylase UbiE
MESTSPPVFADNSEAIEAWDGPLFDAFQQYRHVIVTGLKAYGDAALRLHPPLSGERVLDIGCGFGDTTQQIGALVGPDGRAIGIDAAPRFIAAATAEAEAAGLANVAFAVADVERSVPGADFDLAFSRMGTMFFASPVAALRNVRGALRPAGRLVMVVWRLKLENDWLYRAQTITERFVTKPDEYDAPTCGPGPFSMANADTVSGMLLSAGFADITLRRCDLPIMIGRDLDEAVEFVMALGPAGEILRLSGDRAAHLHPPVAQALHEGLAEFVTDAGVHAPGSSWIISANVPA